MTETKPTEEANDPAQGAGSGRLELEAPPADAPVEDTNGKTTGEGDEHAADADDDDGETPEATSEEKAKADDADREPDLLPRGNPLRVRRGLIGILAGAVPAFLLMAKNGQNAWGVPVGALLVAICAWGVMDLLGTFDDGDEHVVTSTGLGALGGPMFRAGAVAVAFCGALAAAQAAILPWWGASIAVTGSFLALVACVFDVGRALGPWQKDELGLERPLLHHHGFWVVAIGALLYFPAMGLQSLWDPWETHYGEVAREVLARDDWVSLWWAQDGWFWSKPILNFWIQAIAMATLGTHYTSDRMLFGADGMPSAHPEWAVRTPNVLMTILAMYILYKGVAKVFGRRAGLFGALVLATMPDWFFLAHQTMTDMPFVSSMTAAMGLLLLGLNTDEEERVKVYEVKAFGRTFRLSLWHLVFGAVLLCAIPQILYLLSRNVELVVFGDGPKGFRIHWDEFRSGSAGNCGLPGNEPCMPHSPASVPRSVGANPDGLWPSIVRYFGGFEPSLQGLLWGGLIGGLLYVNWGERRTRRILYVGAWLAAAIATMAKGPAGFGLPMICAFAYVATKKRWSELLRLEMLSGALIILAVAIPWYVAMYVRHGSPFTDRLIFHDMFNRAFSHVHDTNEGDDTGIRYYVWQLGYALFPWTGLAPLGLLWWARRGDSADEGRGDASVLLVMWFLFAFALFTFMGTKFHHYIFPAVPPVAMLVGVVLDDMLGEGRLVRDRTLPTYLGYGLGLGVAAALATWGISRLWKGSAFGVAAGAPEANVPLAVIAGGVGLVAIAIVAMAFRSREGTDTVPAVTADPDKTPYRGGVKLATDGDGRRAAHEQLMLAGAGVVAALVLVLVGRDLAIKPPGSDQPGAIRLLQLFTYNYRRPWPTSLDFEAILWGFTIVGALVTLAFGVRALRRHAVAAFCAFAVVWAVWGIDVYMPKLSPHWGQHEVIEAYYRDRKSPDEVLVAYQMNWKGENFYTSNHVPAFVSTGANFKKWLTEQREKGTKVMYFITEHSRTGGLRSEVGAKSYKEITDKDLNNKFVVVRAEL